MQQVAGRQYVVQCAVGRLMVETKIRSQSAELAVGDHVTDQPAGEREGVDGRVAEWIPPEEISA